VSASHRVTLTVNRKSYSGVVASRMTLADFLRDDLRLTGTHLGCEHGVCGACTVLLDSRSVRSCLVLAVQADGANVITVEGLANGEHLHPIQRAFWDAHALQCGFCTAGLLITAFELISENANPSEVEIREAISGQLCRCTGYVSIIKAIDRAAKELSRPRQAD
jgi:carbon-monoxide dehydrogenase small subunit